MEHAGTDPHRVKIPVGFRLIFEIVFLWGQDPSENWDKLKTHWECSINWTFSRFLLSPRKRGKSHWVLLVRSMSFRHGAFCFGHAAHAFWTWGVLNSSWGVLPPHMGRKHPRGGEVENGKPASGSMSRTSFATAMRQSFWMAWRSSTTLRSAELQAVLSHSISPFQVWLSSRAATTAAHTAIWCSRRFSKGNEAIVFLDRIYKIYRISWMLFLLVLKSCQSC